MYKKILVIVLLSLLVPIAAFTQDISFTILYNNVPYNKEALSQSGKNLVIRASLVEGASEARPHNRNLTTAWGFSCLIEGLEKTILFDTGGDGGILLSNMEKLKVDPQEIDVVVISHIHWDHRGGLLNLLDKNNKITVYLPVSLPQDFKEKVGRKGAKVISVRNPIKICKNVYSTGEQGTWTRLPDALSRQAIGGQVKEQSLVIDTEKGLIVLTGCAHPGVVNIVRNAQGLLKKEKVYFVLGGFHLLAYSEPQVKRIIRDLKKIGVEKVGPSHCTGGRPIELFREAWKENFFDLGCGARLVIGVQ